MSLNDPITKIDALNLKSIQKKLKLGLKDFARGKKVQFDDTLTDDEKARVFLGIPDDQSTQQYLEEKLNAAELKTIRKFVKLPF